LILASTITLSITATRSSYASATATREQHRAANQLRYLTVWAGVGLGIRNGRSAEFNWRVVNTAVGVAGTDVQICDEDINMVSRRSGRRYRLSTAAICGAPAPS
jgi:hypothetical protein